MFPGPLDERFELFIGEDFFQGVQFAAQVFFTVLLVNERMAAATHVDATGAHLFAAEVFAKPFVFVASSGDQMVKGDVVINTAELAYMLVSHTWFLESTERHWVPASAGMTCVGYFSSKQLNPHTLKFFFFL